MVGDGDAVAGDQQADHDLGTVPALVSAVAEAPGVETIGRGLFGLEVGRGQVVADEAEVQVGQIGEATIEVGLELLFGRGDGVDAAVALVERRSRHLSGQCHVVQPLEDRPALRPRTQKTVGRHHEDDVGQVLGTAPVTEFCEERLEPEPREVCVHRRHRPEARRTRRRELVGVEPRALGVVRKAAMMRSSWPLRRSSLTSPRRNSVVWVILPSMRTDSTKRGTCRSCRPSCAPSS